MPLVKVIRKGITPAIRKVPTSTCAAVMPMTLDRVDAEAATENEELVKHLVHEVPTLKIEQTRTILPWRDHFDGAFAARFVLTG